MNRDEIRRHAIARLGLLAFVGFALFAYAWLTSPAWGRDHVSLLIEDNSDEVVGGIYQEEAVGPTGSKLTCKDINSPDKCASVANFACIDSGNGPMVDKTHKWDALTQTCTAKCASGKSVIYKCEPIKPTAERIGEFCASHRGVAETYSMLTSKGTVLWFVTCGDGTQGIIDEPDPVSSVYDDGKGNLCEKGEKCP